MAFGHRQVRNSGVWPSPATARFVTTKASEPVRECGSASHAQPQPIVEDPSVTRERR
jgi:hypothetical protein